MSRYQVRNIFGNRENRILEVPGSKSITNRALLLAALADGTSRLRGVLFSDDSRYFIRGLQDLGFEAEIQEEKKEVRVRGMGGRIPRREGKVYVGSAGTAARFLTAMLAFAGGRYELDASEQMRKRPMKPLLDALQTLGIRVEYLKEEGHFPFILDSCRTEINGGTVSVDIGISSQFLSALLMAGVMLPEGLHIHLTGERKSLPYVEMTAKMMEQFGIRVVKEDETDWYVPGIRVRKEKGQSEKYHACEYAIEPDMSGACYFYAMALILGIKVQVKGVHFDSLQGDKRFLEVLETLGCQVEDVPEGVEVVGPKNGQYPGIAVNMNDFSDQTMTMAAVAAFASSQTMIEGIAHIRYQESDRIHAICTELNKMGIRCEESEDGLTIYPGKVQPSVVETYDDHRMAMAFALIGLRAEGIVIDHPECCAKTFENYFEILDNITRSDYDS